MPTKIVDLNMNRNSGASVREAQDVRGQIIKLARKDVHLDIPENTKAAADLINEALNDDIMNDGINLDNSAI
jgi:predicted RNase H-related nuclease YkuK (DUF458 family)